MVASESPTQTLRDKEVGIYLPTPRCLLHNSIELADWPGRSTSKVAVLVIIGKLLLNECGD